MIAKLLKTILITSLALALHPGTAAEARSFATNDYYDSPSIFECGNEELVADLEVLGNWRQRYVVSEEDGNSVYGKAAYTRVIRIYCKGHDIRYLVGGGQFFSIFSEAEVVPQFRRGQTLRQLRLQRTPYRNTGRGYHFTTDFE